MVEIQIDLEGEIGKYVIFKDNSLHAQIGSNKELKHSDITERVGKKPISGGIYFIFKPDRIVLTTGTSEYGSTPLKTLEDLKPEIEQVTGFKCKIENQDF